MIHKIKGAIFDMDGTLIDSLMLWEIMWKAIGKRFLNDENFYPSEEADKAVRTMTLKDSMDYIHSLYGIGDNGDQLLQISNEIIENFYENEVQLKKGVRNFLEYCYQNGIKMCIASASDMKLIKIAVSHCNIEKYFSGIFSCVEIGKGKNEPDLYLRAIEHLGTEKEETCVFEDSHIAITTAQKLGLKTVGIYDKYNYGQEEMQKIATEYIKDGETLEKLIMD